MQTNRFKIMRAIAATTATSALLLGMGTSQLQAADSGDLDRKHMPATMCIAVNSVSVNPSAVYTFNGEIKNESSTELLEVVCPLQMDNVSSDNGLSYVSVYYDDRHPSEDISCDVFRLDKHGDIMESVNRVSTGTGKGRLNFNSDPVASDSFNTTYIVRCEIPETVPNGDESRLHSIIWRENV